MVLRAFIGVAFALAYPLFGVREFHVAPNGSDNADGSTQSPFATVERARDAVRDLKRARGGALKQPVTVFVHGGTYRLSRTLLFTPEDSGTAECPVTYRAYRDEKPVISGGHPITGWKETIVAGKTLWVADIPEVREGKWYFRQLWAGEDRRTLARNPNQGFFRVTAVPDLNLKDSYQVPQKRFQFAPGEISRWENLDDVEVVMMTFWVSVRRHIADLDEAGHMVTLEYPNTHRLTDGFGNPPALARYYVENAFEILDAPGEWYLNRKTGKLYYMPVPGEKISEARFVAPVLERLMSLEGDARSGRYVEHLHFRGLAFAHSEWWMPRNDPSGFYQRQGSAPVPGAIRFYGARHCALELCTIAHVSQHAIHFSRGCERNRVVGCQIFDIGTGGIRVGEAERNGVIVPDENGIVHDHPSEETHHIEITDNHIYSGGRTFHGSHGIWIGPSYDNLVAHNHIHDFYYSGISVGWTWGLGKSAARGNIIEYNHVHDIGQGWLNDMGAIYTLGSQPGTIIRYNLLHDVQHSAYIARGVYLDNGSSNMLVEKNITYNTSTGGYGQSFGKGNVIRNNIFAFGRDAQLEPNGGRPNLPPGNNFTYERNIVYWEKGHNLLRMKWNDADVMLRKNLYWQEGGGEIRFGPESWEQWRARGMDEGSLVADPLFVDPARRDFRLKPDSPALKIGFEPFDLSQVGPRPALLRELAK
jgi:hypothetical protein